MKYHSHRYCIYRLQFINIYLNFRSRKRSSSVQWRNQRQQLSHSLSSVSLDDLDPPSSQTNARHTPSEAHPLGVSGNSLKPTPAKPDMSPALIAQTNWNFVEKLLKVSFVSHFILKKGV